MATKPSAELDLDVALVAALLREQHPDLADLPLRVVAHGWDNAVVRLGADLAVRLPRRAAAAELVRHEQRWLPGLAPRLPVPVPTPVRVGVPSARYPWAWSIVPWLPGRTAASVPPAERAAWAPLLAEVAAGLRTPADPDAPVNPFRAVPLAARDTALRARLGVGAVPADDRLLAVWELALAAPPWSGPPVWVHGDLHPANLLVADGTLAAVLDFGDLTSGDPATDLATAWLTFDPPGRAAFRTHLDEHRGSDEAAWARGRGWALSMGAAMLAHGDDDPVIAAIGRHALAQVLVD
ncbi:aminoglycoside phosphotransferase family protein [Cellulomonas hominis]